MEIDPKQRNLGIPNFHIGRQEPDMAAARLKAATKEAKDLVKELGKLGKKFGYSDVGARVLKQGEVTIEAALHRDEGSGALVVEIDDRGLAREKMKPQGIIYTWETTDRDGNPIGGDIFYKANQDDRNPLVKNRQKVAPGQVVLWGLAQKIDTPIPARDEGEINIVVGDGQHVEHGEILFYIKPTNQPRREDATKS